MTITVGICTWNRAALLAQTLTRLSEIEVPTGLSWEVVVVDNNCTDATPSVLASFEKSGRLPLRFVRETQQGHSHARNRAVAEARGELLLWTDDDVLVHPHWLREMAAAADAHPEAVYFGGPVRPRFLAPPPAWVRDNIAWLGYCWALVDYGPETRPFHSREYPYGANLAFRMQVLRQHPFDPAFGRVKGQLTSGDDTRVVDAVRAAGGQGIWVGSAGVEHLLPAERLTPRYVSEVVHWAGFHDFQPYANDPAPRLGRIPRWLWKRRAVLALRRRLLTLRGGPAWAKALHDSAKASGLAARFRVES